MKLLNGLILACIVCAVVGLGVAGVMAERNTRAAGTPKQEAEWVGRGLYRWRVPGGWVYEQTSHGAICFVPDAPKEDR